MPPDSFTECVARWGGRISFVPNQTTQEIIIDIVSDVRKITPIAHYFMLAADVEKVEGGIKRLKQPAFNDVVLEKCILFGLIHANPHRS